MDDANKNLKIRKLLKDVVFKRFAECNTRTEKKLKSVYETLKRKINPVKNIEDKIINVLSSEKLMEHVIMKSNEFKIEAKQQPDMKNT